MPRAARRLLRAVLPLLAVLLLAACGSSSDDDTASAGSGASGGSGAFPATVEHRYGTTTVERRPKRIVVVGLTEHDVVLQLGFKPIATTKWYADQPYGVWPWARPLLGDAKPTVLKTDDGYQWDKILALRPDLIIGTNSGMTRGDYERFSKMAPTLPSVKGGTDYFSRWDRQTELIAAALGKPEEGRRIVADVKRRYADVAKQHPEWQGETATFTQNGFFPLCQGWVRRFSRENF
jgi:iron complex transport system substrate-binding protein